MINTTSNPSRIYSIDMLKGICMIFMLIDHWRIQLTSASKVILGSANPLPYMPELLENVHTASFWLHCLGSHFVAPSFLFLAGAGCFLWQRRKGEHASLRKYLVSRGTMLALVNCLLFFSSPFSQGGVITLHVLWPTGIGMIILAFIYKWPRAILWGIVAICMIGQSTLETISFSSIFVNTIWKLAFVESAILLPWGAELYNLWPVMPWFSMLLLGYLCGSIFLLGQKSASIWAKLSLLSLGLFLFLRFTGIFGDPSHWQIYDTTLKTLGAIINVNKYPPSFQYILYGLGITFLMLAILEKKQITNKMLLAIGGTPLFFYIVHTQMLRVVKFLILRLPDSILDNISSLLFSFTGIMLGIIIFCPILWFLCVQYKAVMKKLKTHNVKI